ncbi:MAG: protein kinase domain-containing protein [Chthoniobacterales bacterium]
MADPRTERVAELVKSALERPPEGWRAFLDQECGEGPDVRAEVESLLAEQESIGNFLQKPALRFASENLVPDDSRALGQVIGDYEILSLIARGGMGEVYLAHDRQLRRKVALKLIRRGMDSDVIVRHFQREGRLLASLNHPNIAQLYGGGLTPEGVPYFAMEYVDGERLDEYCETRSLTMRERLELFRKICAAVTYAHQHLVIHRDIKQGNIRVTAAGEPKLLDFGIAKLLEPETSLGEEPTVTLAWAMTPEYASPEQVRGEAVTTTSDVYSLGVLLYRLLTGHSPYRTKTSRPEELAQAISDQEPTPPSSALSTRDSRSGNRESTDGKPGLASDGLTARFTIHDSRSLRGDLDNIVLKALRKEPERRYPSVAELSKDVACHLEGLPVGARKDTWSYRSGKFIRRHRVGAAAAALVMITLCGAIIATTWQARLARQEKANAQSVSAFLERLLKYSNPLFSVSNSHGGQTTMIDVLDEAARRIASPEFSQQPQVKAELEKIIGESYGGQGRQDLWEKHLEQYIAVETRVKGENSPELLEATALRATILLHRDEALSEKIFRRTLPLMRVEYAKGRLPPRDLVDATINFGYLRRMQGDSREAEAAFREALALSAQLPPEERYLVRLTRSTLASTLADQGKYDEALRTARDAVAEYRQARQTDTADYAFALTVLGGFLTEAGNFAEADAALARAESILRRRQSPSALWLGDALRNEALSFYRQGKYALAQERVNEARRIYLDWFGPTYDQYPTTLITAGLILDETGRPREGEKLLREAVRLRASLLPRGHFWLALANSALGSCLTKQGRFEEAEPLLRQSYESLKSSQGPNNPRTKLALQRLVAFYASSPRNKLKPIQSP